MIFTFKSKKEFIKDYLSTVDDFECLSIVGESRVEHLQQALEELPRIRKFIKCFGGDVEQ